MFVTLDTMCGSSDVRSVFVTSMTSGRMFVILDNCVG